MIKELGTMKLCECDSVHVPISIYMDATFNSNDEYIDKPSLRASCLKISQHRDDKATHVVDKAYHVEADTWEELQQYMSRYILPLYENAISNIADMISPGCKCVKHHFWHAERNDHWKSVNEGECIGGPADGEIYKCNYRSADYGPNGPPPIVSERYRVFSANNPDGAEYHWDKESKKWIYQGQLSDDEHLKVFEALGIEVRPLRNE